MPISMKPAKNQDRFFEKRFCGTRGSTSFQNTQRPVQGSEGEFNCPEGHVQCSPETGPESTVCVEKIHDCPLTFVQFVEDSDLSEYQASAADYEI